MRVAELTMRFARMTDRMIRRSMTAATNRYPVKRISDGATVARLPAGFLTELRVTSVEGAFGAGTEGGSFTTRGLVTSRMTIAVRGGRSLSGGTMLISTGRAIIPMRTKRQIA